MYTCYAQNDKKNLKKKMESFVNPNNKTLKLYMENCIKIKIMQSKVLK